MSVYFRQANMEELDDIVEVFEAATDTMNQSNIFQWDEIYPDREILYQDILKNQLYVGVMGDVIVAVYVLNQEGDEQYCNGNWEWPMNSYYIIHRLCVNPKNQNQGVGTLTVKYIEEFLREKGIQSIRLDAFTQNPYAIQMYQRLGYQTVGYANWRKGKFCLMEKQL